MKTAKEWETDYWNTPPRTFKTLAEWAKEIQRDAMEHAAKVCRTQSETYSGYDGTAHCIGAMDCARAIEAEAEKLSAPR